MAKQRGRMPEGTMSMTAAARMVKVRPERATLIKETWSANTKRKMAERKRLLAAVRTGDQVAIERLAKEYRCRVWFEHDL